MSIGVVAAILVFGGLALSGRFGEVIAGTPSGGAPSTELSSEGSPAAAALDAAAATRALDALAVKPEQVGADYRREADFGTAWEDVDGNGCDTRNDVLARDLSGISLDDRCRVLTGTLVSPYSGETIDFVRGPVTSEEVQIDHVVALSDAWRTGAQELSSARRLALANDPLELLAVDGTSNQSKGNKDASQWLPENASYHCAYVTRQIQVKAKYQLWVTSGEKAAIAGVLAGCP